MTDHKALKRASEREAVAQMLERMAARAGATSERFTLPFYPREITLHLRSNGAACVIHLNGASRAGAFLAHWRFDDRDGRLFCDGFDGHGYRAHHKATTMSDTAEALCDRVEAMLGWIRDGSAFITEEATGRLQRPTGHRQG